MQQQEKRVVITGASGLLGRSLVKCFQQHGWQILGFAFQRVKPGLVKVDINDERQVSQQFATFKPHVVVNSAAQRFPDKVDSNIEESFRLNVTAAQCLAKLCDKNGIHFLQISTDYVFSGTKAPYTENDETDAINNYGKSKAAAEKAVLEVTNGKGCVLRVPVLFGEEEYVGESAVSALLKDLLDSKTEKSISDYELRNPSCVDDVANICQQLMDAKLQDPVNISGIYHWCGDETLTKYKMIQIIAKVFGKKADHIKPDPNPSKGAPRPYNTKLSRTRLEQLKIGKHTEFATVVAKCYKQFMQ